MSFIFGCSSAKITKIIFTKQKVFEWKNIRINKSKGETKYRSHTFHEFQSKHDWYLELEEHGNKAPAFVRLCLASVESPETKILVRFTFLEQKDFSSEPIISNTFVFSNAKLASEWYTLPSKCTYTNVWLSLEFDSVFCLLLSEKDCQQHDILGHHTNKNQQDFLSFLRNGDSHDVTIAVEGKEIKCHKSVLCWRSPYFDAMFKSGLIESKENRIEIVDFDYETINAMTTFLYTFECPKLTTSTAMSILQAADKYQVSDLKNICEKHLVTEIDTSNAMDILLYADVLSLQQIKERAMTFIWDNFAAFNDPDHYEPLLMRPDLFRELMLAKANIR